MELEKERDPQPKKQTRYYIRVRGRVLGPFDLGQLKTLRERSQFGRANEVSVDGKSWESASTIEHLFEGGASRKSRADAEKATRDETPAASGPPTRKMAPVWYYSVAEEQCGPVTLLELRGLISSGQLVTHDLVWKEGMTDWIPIVEVAELNSVAKMSQLFANAPFTGVVQALQNFCYACGSPTDARAEVCPKCGVRQTASTSNKNRLTAALLAGFFGGFGVHHFYLGNIWLGVIYLLFFWTVIPAIAALVEMIVFLSTSDESFNRRYNTK
jgi:TM2 domain-containing membrane protein YozV